MGRLSFKLRKNKNYTDISHYQIYLPTLHENVLKYNWLNLFKEIAIDFNHGLWTISESPESLFDGLFFKLVNVAIILAFSSFFGYERNFVGLSFNRAPHMIIKRIAIQWDGQMFRVMWLQKFSHS